MSDLKRGAEGNVLRGILVAGAALFILMAGRGAAWGDPPLQVATAPSLTDLSLEELMNVEVVTFSKNPERLFDTPAAIYVITQEDIRRSGVTSIPEALRMAPGVEVARINSSQWAIGIRGFNSRLSRSILVLIDGRSVYSPLFAGVYWEAQDLMLEDVERIEVIRGPGGTIWGANAVNGVINIITKHSKETQGGLVTLGGGTEEQGFGGVRYGGAIGENLHYRVYGKYFNRDAGFHAAGNDFDDWRMGQGGFRADLDLPNRNDMTLQGDIYSGKLGQRTLYAIYTPPFSRTVEEDGRIGGGNLLFHWGHVQSERLDWTLKIYYDRTLRDEANFQEERDTTDLDFQSRFRFLPGQELTWGLGYRLSAGKSEKIAAVTFDPPRSADSLYSAFAQYKISFLEERVVATLGSKFEHNDYSGFEIQPSARLIWKATPDQVVWTAITRAVRTPSRVERDLQAAISIDPTRPTFLRLVGNDSFDSERVVSYELGYRVQPTRRVLLTSTAFYNHYTSLTSLEPGAPFAEAGAPNPDRLIFPLFFENRMEGKSYGAEMMSDVKLLDWWRINLIYSFLELELQRKANSQDAGTEQGTEGASPHHQVGLRSLMELPGHLEFDWFLRYVDKLPAQATRQYYNLDVRVGWRPRTDLELSVVGQNLLDNHHPEFGPGSSGVTDITEVERGVYAKVTYLWK